MPDRASKKLFTKDTLLPGAGKFPEPSQKICSATSSRYFIFWISSVMNEFLKQFGDQATTYMLQLVMVCINIFLFGWPNYHKKNLPTYYMSGFHMLRYQTAIVGALATMEHLSLAADRVLSEAACAEYKRNYLIYRSALNWLAHENVRRGRCRYHIRPKCHQYGHLVFNHLPLNPRKFTNYLDEDYIYRTKAIAQVCHPLFMPMQVCMRYSIAVCLRWGGPKL